MERIALHTMTYHNHEAMISTVKVFGAYETMVMYSDGEEIEVITTATEADARAAHNRLMNKYNDLIYTGSIAQLLGVPNLGQFVRTVKAC